MTLVTKIMWVQKGLRTRTVHCIQNHTVVDEKLCDNAVSVYLYSQATTKEIIIIHCPYISENNKQILTKY